MRVAVALECRFLRTPDGRVWTLAMFPYSFWERYLEVFDEVRVIARAQAVNDVPGDAHRVDGARVSVYPVPCYIGPLAYLRQRRAVLDATRRGAGPHDALILRVPSQVGSCLEHPLRRTGRPVALEVVGDPYAVFAPGAVRHPLRPVFRWLFTRRLQRQCGRACAVAYVTKASLQRRYPAAEQAFATYYSDVALAAGDFATAERQHDGRGGRVNLVTVGSLEQWYKGTDVLIDAVDRCCRRGIDLQLSLVGDGKLRPALEQRVAALSLGDRITFRGKLAAGQAVLTELDRADVFVLPSRTEGLPRALIEAMARGLPCIGSAVGGIPELLSAEDLVPAGDVPALARKIEEVVTVPQRMTGMSARNLAVAREYVEEGLRARRVAFYTYVRQATQRWRDGR